MLGVGQRQHLFDRHGRMKNLPPRGQTAPIALRENGSSYGCAET